MQQAKIASPLLSEESFAERSRSLQALIRTLSEGGTATISGIITFDQFQVVTSKGLGWQNSVPRASLEPLPTKLNLMWLQFRKVISSNQQLAAVIEKLLNGTKPDQEMVRTMALLASPTLGHAIAGVGILQAGPLKGTVIALNPWGQLELYPPPMLKDGLEFTLFK